MRRPAAVLAAALLLLPATAPAAEKLDAAGAVTRYLEARGGAERWRALEGLELTGVYAAFSFQEPFRLLRQRGDRYRLDYVVLGSPAVRARDGEGPWMQDPLLQPEAARVAEEPYKSQLERESLFGLALLDSASRGIAVELLGEGEVEGRSTVDLRLTFPDERQEVWHLDAETWLEVAVDAEVWDHTQSSEPMRRRTFFDDFREVEGLMIPFQVDHEFGARLEAMTVERARLDPELAPGAFAPPPAPEAPADPNPSPAGHDTGPQPGSG